ncbi:uncharacterized protein MONBRDRAFT_9140 [Monosiga brevicollis MX1]|uniref:protein acetyllysine N-acetyltransferase n=1 Tax=Monosiga brevicollis TaxID=81824 RepID=A9V275_MONBE|nr:uncharacterized protein MONBRDRAFT_9140 [Monosiga brevicollis MX1]EDQ88330.1 predicted protein [Monosiga brevicollis MX1]|eukprot:XP_001746923.1 hypothetical protein [Monosiga brevicollis MX1]
MAEEAAVEEAAAEEQADIDRILEERGRGRKKEYLCSWMDGAEPQWVAARYLKGTVALDEWRDAEDEVPEIREPEAEWRPKVEQLARWLQEAQRPCILLGAGISAPVLPTFRGAGGLWTKRAKRQAASTEPLAPTAAHEALVALERKGHVDWLATQNYDNLTARSGFPMSKVSELHGNLFKEVCERCGATYFRDYEVELATAVDHETGRHCEVADCSGRLRDNIIHFGEDLPAQDFERAEAHFGASDLRIALGTSLAVEPAAGLLVQNRPRPRLRGARRRAKGRDTNTALTASPTRARVCIVNLQPTPYDDQADLLVRATCDDVLRTLDELL